MSICRRRARSCRSLFLPGLVAIVLSSSYTATAGPRPLLDSKGDAIRNLLVSQARKGTSTSIQKSLRGYNRVEAQKSLDIFARYKIHQELLDQVKKTDGATLYKIARSYLKKSGSSYYPSQVLVLKAVSRSKGKIAQEDRAGLFLDAARSRDRRLVTWSIRLFADLREAAVIDALIDLLSVEEKEGRYFGDLASVIQGELYRVLGSMAVGDSFTIRKNWEKSGKKIPAKPNYSLAASGQGRGATVFFGDRLATRAVFCIDISSSMKGTVKMGKNSKGAPKVEIVKTELGNAVGGLTPDNRFNIISYDGSCAPWRSPKQLVRGSNTNVSAAKSYASGLKTGSGTNIHDAMVLGLLVNGVETVYLLSDGAPSRGGNPEQIRKRVAAMNYLRGIRVVTYGFTGSDEKLMKDLARAHWGWYRPLNK